MDSKLYELSPVFIKVYVFYSLIVDLKNMEVPDESPINCPFINVFVIVVQIFLPGASHKQKSKWEM